MQLYANADSLTSTDYSLQHGHLHLCQSVATTVSAAHCCQRAVGGLGILRASGNLLLPCLRQRLSACTWLSRIQEKSSRMSSSSMSSSSSAAYIMRCAQVSS